jgi:hypothetical protein
MERHHILPEKLVIIIALLSSRVYPVVHTEALEPGDTIVNTRDPVNDEE